MKGIYVTSLTPNGTAAQDKQIAVGDRILKVDGHSLRGLENMDAASVLRNSGDPVVLVLSRRKNETAVGNNGEPGVLCVLPIVNCLLRICCALLSTLYIQGKHFGAYTVNCCTACVTCTRISCMQIVDDIYESTKNYFYNCISSSRYMYGSLAHSSCYACASC